MSRPRGSRSHAISFAAWGLAATLIAAGGVGCGSSSTPVTDAASKQLTTDVDRLTAAAGTRDASAIDAAATALRAHVSAQQRAGQLSGTRASAILAQLTAVLADTTVIVRASVPSSSPTPSKPSTAPEKGKGKKQDEGGKGGGD